MGDPRVNRTNEHIFRILQGVLATTDASNLPFARIASMCAVSRRTLYAHFSTAPQLWKELFLHFYEPMETAVTGSTLEERMGQALRHIRDTLATPVTRAALLASDESFATRTSILDLWREELSHCVAPISPRLFSRLIGPLCLDGLLLRTPASDIAVQELAELALISDLTSPR